MCCHGYEKNYGQSLGSGCLVGWSHLRNYSSMIYLQNYSSETFSSRTTRELVVWVFLWALGTVYLVLFSSDCTTLVPVIWDFSSVPENSSYRQLFLYLLQVQNQDSRSWHSLGILSQFQLLNISVEDCYSCCHCYVGHFFFGASWWDFIICGKQSYQNG